MCENDPVGRLHPRERRVYGRRIREARERAGWKTASAAAKHLGMSVFQMLHLESGKRMPTYPLLNRIITGLGLDPTVLFGPIDEDECQGVAMPNEDG